MNAAGLDRDQWLSAIEKIATALGPTGRPIRLCLIGSVACVFGGMAARVSRDLDVWKPASDYDLGELKRAVEEAGLLFDPKTTLDPLKPYVQLVEPAETFASPAKRQVLENLVYLKIADSEND